MVVLILTAVKPGLRGELAKWMIEPHAGVFVGRLSQRVRNGLWERVCRDLVYEGSAVIVYSARTEQGFRVESVGDRSRIPVDYEGVTLISRFLRH